MTKGFVAVRGSWPMFASFMRLRKNILPLVASLGLLGACDSKEEPKKDAKADAAKKDDAKKDGADKKDAAKPATDTEGGGAADAKPADVDAPKDIVDTAVAAGDFKTLATALEKAGLIETLKGDGPFTVFAPTDAAFAKIPKADLDALLAKPDDLKKVLLMHVVSGKVMAADAAKLTEAEMMSGDKLPVVATDGVTVGGAKVTKTDIESSNGVIHVIDTVILPKS